MRNALPLIALALAACGATGFIASAVTAERCHQQRIEAALYRASTERSVFVCFDKAGNQITDPNGSFGYCTHAYYLPLD